MIRQVSQKLQFFFLSKQTLWSGINHKLELILQVFQPQTWLSFLFKEKVE